MKYQIMLKMLFVLLGERRVTAGELASRFHCSVRSVYRYIDEMTVAGVPVDIARGPRGGLYISDAYKLPKGLLTRTEYRRAIEAMLAMNEQLDDPDLRSAAEKLSAQIKTEKFDTALTGNILVDSGTWGDERRFAEKLALVERAINEREALDIDYIDRGGERTRRRILPHLLVYKQSVWYVYAFCKKRNGFRLFKLGRIRSALRTGETFEPVPFSREDIPLSFWNSKATVSARFAISPQALPFAEEWLGVENIREEEGGYIADLTLPDDDALVTKILSAGAGFKVLSPPSLAALVRREAQKIADAYLP